MKCALLAKTALALLVCVLVSPVWAQDSAAVSPDFDNSGTVDFTDFILFSEGFGLDAPKGSFGAGFDIDGDGRVFFNDLFLLADNLGRGVDEVVFSAKQEGPFENAGATLLLTPASSFGVQAGATLELALGGSGLVGVRQVDLTFALDPPAAFVLNSARFTRDSGTLESSLFSRDADAGTVRVGGFNSQGQADGTASFGTFSVRLADDFSGQAAVRLQSAALGPSSDRQDAFTQDQLDLSLTISSNTPPQLSKDIADLHLSAGLQPYVRDLEANPAVFADEDGDALSYQVSSSSPGVASASLSGSVLTVEAFSQGSTTVTVEADDGSGTTASASFAVDVDAEVPFEIAHIRADQLPAIDADLDEWQDLFGDPVLTSADFLSTVGEVLGPVPNFDQDIEVWLAWNDETNLLYIAARVRDDAYGTTSLSDPLQAWRSDNIEVYLDADNSGGFYSSNDLHAQEYVLNPENKTGAPILFPLVERDEGRALATDPPFVDGAVRRQGTEYVYEMAVPGWNRLAADGTGRRHTFKAEDVIGLALIFADFESQDQADARQHHAHNGLRGPVEAWRDADQLSDFRLQAPANQAPQVAARPEPLFLTLDDESLTLDLNEVFTDPDGDALNFVVNSANPTVVRAELVAEAPSLLRLTLLDTGGSLISLTADDGQATAQVAFTVDVAPGNSPPTVQNPPQDISLVVDGKERVLDLNEIFADADADALVFTARISATGRVGTRLSTDGTLTLTPLAPGSLKVTLTANDGKATAQTAFDVTVEAANTPPTVVAAPQDITLVVGGAEYNLDLNDVFTDADADALNFEANSSAADIADALIALSADADADASVATLTVSPLSPGDATITLSASDGRESAETRFEVKVQPQAASDLDGSGTVDLPDLFAFVESYGGAGPAGDADGDGRVDNTDFFILAENLGRANADVEVPDPPAPPADFSGANADAVFRLVPLQARPPALGKPAQVDVGGVSGIDAISIDTDVFDKVESGQEIAFYLQAERVSQVNQFELAVRLSPPEAFDLSSVAFAENEGFSFSPGVIVNDDGSVEMAAAVLSFEGNEAAPLEGDLSLGTVRLKTTDFFSAGFHADIAVERLALGPRLVEHDIFSSADLDLGLRLNNAAPQSIFSDQIKVQVGSEAFELALDQIVEDPNGDALAYAVSLEDETLARAEIVSGANSVTDGPQVDFLRVTPLLPGSTVIVVEATDPYGAAGSARIPLTVAPAPTPAIAVSAEEINFGEVVIGQSATRSLTVANTGTAELNVNGLGGVEAPFQRGSAAFSLAPEEETQISVNFVPTSDGVFRDTLRLASNDPERTEVEVVLVGAGSVTGALAADDLDFGVVEVGQVRVDTLRLLNQKNIDFTYTELALEPTDTPAFSLVEPLESGVLEAGGVLPIGVRFVPQSRGAAQAVLRWVGADDSLRVALSGNGSAALLELGAAELDFGPVEVGSQRTLDLDLGNGGDAELFIEEIAADNESFSADLDSARVGAGGEQTLRVTFAPQASGEYEALLTLRSNALGAAQSSVSLSGSGAEPPPDPPTAPVPVAPEDGAADQAVSLQLRWNAATGAQTYEVQLDDDGDFASAALERDGLEDTALDIADLATSTTYFWRVRGHNAAGPGAWSAARTFTTFTPQTRPAIPTALAPADEEEVATPTPTLVWSAVEGAQTYRLQVTRTTRFAGDDLVVDADDISDSTYTFETDLVEGQAYLWRVWAANEAGSSSWTPPRSFTPVAPLQKPAIPVPQAPADAEKVATLTPTLIWFKVEGADSYRVQVAQNNRFAGDDLIEDFDGATDTTFAVLAGLEDGGAYQWRVWAANEAGSSSWSAPRSFSVALPAGPPGIPQPDQPADEETVDTDEPVLRWFAVDGAESYRVQVTSIRNNFGRLGVFEDFEPISDTLYALKGLEDGRSYWWRLYAQNEAGVSAWSDPRGFTVQLPTAQPLPPTPAAPAAGSTIETAAVELSWDAAEGATGYTVEVATDSDFENLFSQHDELATTGVSIEDLQDGQTYFWRVRALNEAGPSDWSTTRSFTIALPLQVPGIPTPDTPADGFEVDTLKPTLRWFAVEGATSYRLQVGQNSRYTGDDLIEDADALSDTAFTLLQGLVDGRTYQWRVWAANDAGNSSWSAPRSFTVRTPNFDETSPTFPDAVSAWADAGRERGLTDGEWHAGARPFFEWSGARDEVSGVAGYAVLLTQDPEEPVPLDGVQEQASYSPATDLQETGTYYLLVRVVDAAGNWSAAVSLFTYRYDGTAPVLEASPPSSLTAGRERELQADISDAGKIQTARLHYRVGGAGVFTALELQDDGDTYRATLPGAAVGPRGLQFYFSAADGAGNSATWPAAGAEAPFAPTVDVPEALAKAPDAFPTNQWRMLSVPLSPSNGAPLNLLRLLGAYDDTRWRLFRYFGGAYREFAREDIGAFSPGRAFWLHSRVAGLEFGSGPGQSTDLSSPFEITLEPGWNDIAVPFAFAVAWDDIMRQSGDPSGVVGPYAYDGADWSLPQSGDVLRPWQGYAVNNATSGFVVLQIPPQADDDAGKSAARFDKDRFDKDRFDKDRWGDGGWTLQLKALGNDSQDTHNYLGVRPDARVQWDRRDLPEPPPTPGASVALYFPRATWDRYPGRYASDFRPPANTVEEGTQGGLVWDVAIRGAGPLRLQAGGLADLPVGLSARLLAPDGRLAAALQPGESFALELDPAGETRRLRLVVGADDYLEIQTQGYGSRPTAFVLEPNTPNPFNPETEIAFRLPGRAAVRLAVHDLLGRRVALLWEGERPAGYHRLTWHGLDDKGRPVASGVYLYTLETPQGRFTRKMALVR